MVISRSGIIKRRALHRLAMVFSLIGMVAVVALWTLGPMSWRWDLNAPPRRYAMTASPEWISLSYTSRIALINVGPSGFVISPMENITRVEFEPLFSWRWNRTDGRTVTIRTNPLVLLALFVLYPAAATVYLRLRQARRARLGFCSACGYNLRGNVSGVCPECALTIGDSALTEDGERSMVAGDGGQDEPSGE